MGTILSTPTFVTLGWQLQKRQDETMNPIDYCSRSLNNAVCKWDTTQIKCLAIIWVVLLLRPYFEASRFTICTNHSSLIWILNLSESFGRLAQWQLWLSKSNLDVVYHAATKDQTANALSRSLVNGANTTPLEDDLSLLAIETLDDTNTGKHFIDTISSATSPHDAVHVPSDTPHDTVDTPATPTATEFISEQINDAYYLTMTSLAWQSSTEFHIKFQGLLVQRTTVDGAILLLVATPLWQRVLVLTRYPFNSKVLLAAPYVLHPAKQSLLDPPTKQRLPYSRSVQ